MRFAGTRIEGLWVTIDQTMETWHKPQEIGCKETTTATDLMGQIQQQLVLQQL